MPQRELNIFKVSDEQLLETLKKITLEYGEKVIGFTFKLAEEHNLTFTDENLENLIENENFKNILDFKETLFLNASVSFIDRTAVHIIRDKNYDKANIAFNANLPPNKLAKLFFVAYKNLKSYEIKESLDSLLSKELSEFYRKREESLLRLEQLSQKIIEQNEEYRKKIDKESEDFKLSLKNEHDNTKTKLEEECTINKQKLENQYKEKLTDLENREALLKEKLKELDDRNSKHARRQIRQDLKKALEERSKVFSLTSKTSRKRILIHLLYLLLISLSIIFVWQTIYVEDPASQAFIWWKSLRMIIGALATATSIIFYIKWNDIWFRQHADEEFSLKRLELDIDRASWVVEMALEWKEEEGKGIPSNLLDRLTENLFKSQSKIEQSKHPSEDLASALISASSGVSIKIPGVGELSIDRKGINEFKKGLEKPKQ